MKPPIFVGSFLEEEREALEAELRSKDAFVLPRSQILLASSHGESPPKITASLGCASQTARNANHGFNEPGLGALEPNSSGPRRTQAVFREKSAEAVREMLHRSPRKIGRDSSLWSLEIRQYGWPLRRESSKGVSRGDHPGCFGAPFRSALAASQMLDQLPGSFV
jgi:hypothetical protein